ESTGGSGRRPIFEGGLAGDGGEPQPADMADMTMGSAVDMAFVESACGEVPSGGLCLDDTPVQRRIVPTGQGTPKVNVSRGQSYEMCQVVDAIAQCVPRPGQCAPGASRCNGANARDVCIGGHWQMDACASCMDTGLGTICGMNGSTTRIALTINYQAY